MKPNLFSKLKSFVIMAAVVALLAVGMPRPVQAGAGPNIEIVSVTPDESVMIRGSDFPANHTWTVRMDRSGNLGINGIAVAESRIEKGGSFEAIYRIPAELKSVKTISIRLESTTGGWYVYDWFNNSAGPTKPTPTPVTPVKSGKPRITFVGVKANESVEVEVSNFPANARIKVRVGPYYTFFRGYEVVDYVYSGNGSPFRFTIKLPAVVKDVNLVTVRLDSDTGNYAYNAFRNVDSGTVSPVVTPNPPTTNTTCEILSAVPNRMPLRGDFDAVWTVKNTSGKTWDANSVDFKYVSGTKMHKYASIFDLPQTVKSGETVKIIVDMLAPDQAGIYTANWALVSGSTTLCNLPITINVR